MSIGVHQGSGDLKPEAFPVPAERNGDGRRLGKAGWAQMRVRLAYGLANGLSISEAGRQAGYSKHHEAARQAAHSEEVQALVAGFQQDAADFAGVSLEWAVAFHARVARDEDRAIEARQASVNKIIDVLGFKEEAARRRAAAQERFERMDDDALDDEIERLKGVVDGKVVDGEA